MTFIPNLVSVGQLVQKLKGWRWGEIQTHTHTHQTAIQQFFFRSFGKKRRLKYVKKGNVL
jgi:hypothetical protein